MDQVTGYGPTMATADAEASPLLPAISVRQLSFSYASAPDQPGDLVLDQVEWEVPQGSFTLVMGPTGHGKTTLLRNLKPELVPTGIVSGEVDIFGKSLSEIGAQESAETIGYVAQNPETQIVCDTVWHELAFGLENLGMDTQVMRRRVAEIAHFFGIEPWIDKQTDQLSGGQKQIMNLASVLALRPRILLLDEPTSQLDPVAARNFLHMLFRVNRELGLTVVMVSHDPEMAVDYATDAIWVEGGSVQVRDMAAFRADVHERTVSARFQDYPAPQADAVLEMRDAYVRHSRNDAFVLRGLDLQVKRGSIHTLVGGNGAGKSTLLAAAAGTLKLERGKLRNHLSQSQAYLPQDPKALFVCDTVADELAEWQRTAGYADDDIAAVAARFRLDGALAQHPYDLSGGQQQMLAFAKILLIRPQLLFLDEPTKGLDVLSRYLVADALCELSAHGTTILMTSHDLAFAARVADTVSMLFDGQVTCTQSAAEFFTENLFYRPTVDWFFATWERPQNSELPR